MSSEMSVAEFEEAVLALEEVRVVVRAPLGSKVKPFTYERKSAGSTSVSDWLEKRIKPLLGGFECVVVKGDGVKPHGRTQMDRVRASYTGE